MVLSIIMGVISLLGAVNIEYEQSVFELTAEIETDSLTSIISGLSGEVPVVIDGTPDSIPCRLAITEGAHKAALWLGEQLQARGVQAEVQEFDADLGVFRGPLPLGTEAHDLAFLTSDALLSENPYPMWNVVGTLPGEDTYEILVTAHYDAISDLWFEYTPGADDNASGVAGVLEIARIMADVNWKHTIKFILFGGEELGLHGSYHYVDQVVQAGNEDKILGVLNLDMIAYNSGAPPEIDIHCHPWDETSHEQAEMLADIIDVYGFNLISDIHTTDASDRSDHSPFWPRLIPAMMFIEDYDDFNPFYHTTDDRIFQIDTDYLTESVKSSLAWTATMAESDAFTPGVAEQRPDPTEIASIRFPSTVAGSNIWAEIYAPYEVTPTIYDAAGQKVKTLQTLAPSQDVQRIQFAMTGLASGTYWLRLNGLSASQAERFVFIR